MKIAPSIIGLCFMLTSSLFAQTKSNSIPLIDNKDLAFVNVIAEEANYLGKNSLKVMEQGESSEARFVTIKDLDFKSGSIEIDVVGKPAAGSSQGARGFVGVAFRINGDDSKFECFYLRPTNGRAEDQLRRNHSVQYISFPDYSWHKLRKESPGKYESYVDMAPGEWIKLRLEIDGDLAKLFVHGNSQPTLIVNDLKHGSDSHGNIGLWIGPGTEAYFSNLVVTNTE